MWNAAPRNQPQFRSSRTTRSAHSIHTTGDPSWEADRFFKLFLSDTLMDSIVQHTNSRMQAGQQHTTPVELLPTWLFTSLWHKRKTFETFNFESPKIMMQTHHILHKPLYRPTQGCLISICTGSIDLGSILSSPCSHAIDMNCSVDVWQWFLRTKKIRMAMFWAESDRLSRS